VADQPTVPVQIPVDWQRAHTRRVVDERYARAAYVEYAKQYGTAQSFERLHERGGFSATEIMGLLCDRIDRLAGELAGVTAARNSMARRLRHEESL
jgi:hypothetical protein